MKNGVAGTCGKVGAFACCFALSSATLSDAALNKVLVFSRCDRYEHTDSKKNMIAYVNELGSQFGFDVVASDNAAQVMTDQALAQFDLTIWNNNCWLDLSSSEKEAFRRYMESGGNYVGVHCAGAMHGLWPWYSLTLVNTDLLTHAGVVPGRAYVEQKNRDHPVLKDIPDEFWISEEWYRLDPNPADNPESRILVLVDESTYDGAKIGGYHPMAWVKELEGGGRMFYTAFGHPPETYTANQNFRTLVKNAILWAGQDPLASRPDRAPGRESAIKSAMEPCRVEIYDVVGRRIDQYSVGSPREARDRPTPSGLHLLRVSDGSGRVIRKMNVVE